MDWDSPIKQLKKEDCEGAGVRVPEGGFLRTALVFLFPNVSGMVNVVPVLTNARANWRDENSNE